MKQEQESLSPESNCYGGPDLPEKEEEQWLREGGNARGALGAVTAPQAGFPLH